MNSNDRQNRRWVTRTFQARGLVIQPKAVNGMLSILRREDKENASKMMQAVVEEIKNRSSSIIVSEHVLSQVVADMSPSDDATEDALQLLNAFDMPKLCYHVVKKQFQLMPSDSSGSIFGKATDKVDMFLQRYELIQQRILRQELFRPKLVTTTSSDTVSENQKSTHSITPVESLLGRGGVRFLLGMIVQVEEGKYYLEDHTSRVLLDLSQSSLLTDGFITEQCIVLVEGELIDGVLLVHRLGNPFFESRWESIEYIGLRHLDIFDTMPTLSALDKMREMELKHSERGIFVILSNVFLDTADTMSKLDQLFAGFQDAPDLPVFVFMGSFTSKPIYDDPLPYWEDLAQLIAKYSRLAKEGRFIFIPGPQDPGLCHVLPQPTLPSRLMQTFQKAKISHAISATNPCRLRYFSKELVFFRQDLVRKFVSNHLIPPRDGSTVVQHVVKSILDQSHLCPLPSSCIYWNYDYALRLYPLPDAVILGDQVEAFYENYAECDVINPGPFSTNNFQFVVYRPSDITEDGTVQADVEFSQIE